MRGLFANSSEAHFEVAFAPESAIPNKLVEKTRGKSTKKWRKMALYGAFSRGKSAISAVLRADCARLQHARAARLYVHGAWLPRAASDAPNRQWGAIFRGPGHETTYVGHGRFEDCADVVARLRANRRCDEGDLRAHSLLPALSFARAGLRPAPSPLTPLPGGARGTGKRDPIPRWRVRQAHRGRVGLVWARGATRTRAQFASSAEHAAPARRMRRFPLKTRLILRPAGEPL